MKTKIAKTLLALSAALFLFWMMPKWYWYHWNKMIEYGTIIDRSFDNRTDNN